MFLLKFLPSSTTAIAAFLLAVPVSQAAITASLNSGFFQTTTAGVKVPAGTLFQLVDLGPNGVFDQISIADGSTDHLTSQWVSGDDTVLAVPWEGSNTDFSSLAAFDLTNGPDTPGAVDRQFVFTAAIGTKFGIRWFPGLQASDYYLPGGIALAFNQPYGQFTRQNDPTMTGPLYDGPVYGLNNWVYTANGDAINLDPLITQSAGGSDANSLGMASPNLVVPEPSTALLFCIGATGLSLRRRQNHR